ncbi:hypothetical protein [Methanonatronarchaeum sp. AMET-Sl]|uniref:hypothetical protein n=1 Tax=Methanonatronarchaeum sp. AMET-Sl TaxID=3037654 RepID=UPI00244E562F|nr:hypothetical protein [Methanonatronarchaeum sp. AMET-Sl]WGI17526.1 hypothetical protein QEN48_00530 [Methanonatronarchaeum sp. AMET-Sl]
MKKQNETQKRITKNPKQTEFICENCNTTYKKDLLMSNEIRCPNCQSLKLFYTDNNKPKKINKLHKKIKEIFGKT